LREHETGDAIGGNYSEGRCCWVGEPEVTRIYSRNYQEHCRNSDDPCHKEDVWTIQNKPPIHATRIVQQETGNQYR
jgi:hypothetical protein